MVSMTWGIPCSVLPPHSTGLDALTSLRESWGRNMEDSIESRLEIYKVTPLAENESAEHILVTTPDASFTMQHVEHLLEQRENFKIHVERLTEALFHCEETREKRDRDLAETRQLLAEVEKERASALAERSLLEKSPGEGRSDKRQQNDGLQSPVEKFPGEDRSEKRHQNDGPQPPLEKSPGEDRSEKRHQNDGPQPPLEKSPGEDRSEKRHQNERASRKLEESGTDKLNQMHQMNKKLREETKALKARLGQSESCRMETQQAVEHLRREFMILVNELLPPDIRPTIEHPSARSRDTLTRSARPGVGVSY
eukprot:GEMP01073162.1.p1 GENE.GEMP01073162.1~~GEMP01073162.1.p1  ORF type:complete len:310 (+),score=46.93 GEMP01073162.1:91-1020(+)